MGLVELTVMLRLNRDGVEDRVDGVGAGGLEAVVMLVANEGLVPGADVVIQAEDLQRFVGDGHGVAGVVDRAGASRTRPDGGCGGTGVGEAEAHQVLGREIAGLRGAPGLNRVGEHDGVGGVGIAIVAGRIVSGRGAVVDAERLFVERDRQGVAVVYQRCVDDVILQIDRGELDRGGRRGQNGAKTFRVREEEELVLAVEEMRDGNRAADLTGPLVGIFKRARA